MKCRVCAAAFHESVGCSPLKWEHVVEEQRRVASKTGCLCAGNCCKMCFVSANNRALNGNRKLSKLAFAS